MASNHTLEVSGQIISVRRLDPMARRIAARIDGGRSVVFAGFVWYRPQTQLPQHIRPADQEPSAQAWRAVA